SLFNPPGRFRVSQPPGGRQLGENDQAVARTPTPTCLVSRRAHITAAIIIAVSRHIDCTPRGVEGRARELRQGKIEPAADGRAVGKRTGYFQQLISKLPGAVQVLDQGPIDDESLRARTGPLDEAHRNLPMQARSKYGDGPSVIKCGGISLSL